MYSEGELSGDPMQIGSGKFGSSSLIHGGFRDIPVLLSPNPGVRYRFQEILSFVLKAGILSPHGLGFAVTFL